MIQIVSSAVLIVGLRHILSPCINKLLLLQEKISHEPLNSNEHSLEVIPKRSPETDEVGQIQKKIVNIQFVPFRETVLIIQSSRVGRLWSPKV